MCRHPRLNTLATRQTRTREKWIPDKPQGDYSKNIEPEFTPNFPDIQGGSFGNIKENGTPYIYESEQFQQIYTWDLGVGEYNIFTGDIKGSGAVGQPLIDPIDIGAGLLYGIYKSFATASIVSSIGGSATYRGSILANASKAAFNAADDVGSIFIKNKHLSSATGNYAKFATTEISTAQGWVQQALRSPNARFLPNPQIPNTFQVVTDLGATIGTKGQTSIRAIDGFDGKVINAFPVK